MSMAETGIQHSVGMDTPRLLATSLGDTLA